MSRVSKFFLYMAVLFAFLSSIVPHRIAYTVLAVTYAIGLAITHAIDS